MKLTRKWNPTVPKEFSDRYFDMLIHAENVFLKEIELIEKDMKLESGIKDIEFFWGESGIVGIGNESRTMKLIHREK